MSHDAVITKNAYFCSACRVTHAGGPVVRWINLRPDHPLEVESVDALICSEQTHAAVQDVRDAMLESVTLDDRIQQFNAYIGKAGAFRVVK